MQSNGSCPPQPRRAMHNELASHQSHKKRPSQTVPAKEPACQHSGWEQCSECGLSQRSCSPVEADFNPHELDSNDSFEKMHPSTLKYMCWKRATAASKSPHVQQQSGSSAPSNAQSSTVVDPKTPNCDDKKVAVGSPPNLKQPAFRPKVEPWLPSPLCGRLPMNVPTTFPSRVVRNSSLQPYIPNITMASSKIPSYALPPPDDRGFPTSIPGSLPADPALPYDQFSVQMIPHLNEDSDSGDQTATKVKELWDAMTSNERLQWEQSYEDQVVDCEKRREEWNREREDTAEYPAAAGLPALIQRH